VAKYHGRSVVFTIDDSGGTVRNISSDVDSTDAPSTIDTAEVTGFGDAQKSYVTGQQDQKVSIKGNFNDTALTGAHAVLSSLIGGTAGYTLQFMPAGSVSGKPKLYGEVLLTNYSLSAGVGGAVTFAADFVPVAGGSIVWGTI